MENQFIEKAKNIHKNIDGTTLYDYSKVKYVKAIEKVIIICKKHGDFLQRPNDHYRYGCPKCGIEKRCTRLGEYVDNFEKFVKHSNIIHNNKYDYTVSVFINLTTKIKINCFEHGIFEQTPSDHLDGQKCRGCAGILHRRTQDSFIQDAKLFHEDKYDYSKTIYSTIYEDVIITCKIHGDYIQKPVNHFRSGCSECGKIKNSEYFRSTTEEFIEKSIKIHGDKYDYSQVEYKTNMDKINIVCKMHGVFSQTPCGHLGGKGCKECGRKRTGLAKRDTLQTFIQKAKSIYGDKYDYSKVDYINSNTDIIIICKEHGEFKKRPNNHISSLKQGCQKCQVVKQYSKMSIDWLKFCEKYYNIIIQHAENTGEYIIPNSRYKADGYCKETNTIFEFHGSKWHGDPILYNKKSKIFFGIDYGTLYENTIKKENFIKENGYNLIVMWESKWKKINKCIKILQKQYRRFKCPKV